MRMEIEGGSEHMDNLIKESLSMHPQEPTPVRVERKENGPTPEEVTLQGLIARVEEKLVGAMKSGEREKELRLRADHAKLSGDMEAERAKKSVANAVSRHFDEMLFALPHASLPPAAMEGLSAAIAAKDPRAFVAALRGIEKTAKGNYGYGVVSQAAPLCQYAEKHAATFPWGVLEEKIGGFSASRI